MIVNTNIDLKKTKLWYKMPPVTINENISLENLYDQESSYCRKIK